MPPLCPKRGIRRIKPHMLGDGDVRHPPITVALDSNENAYGPSPAAISAATQALAGIERYQENPEAQLAPALASRFDLDRDAITIGHGSDDLLSRLARAYLDPGTELIRSVSGYLKTPNYAYANDAWPVSVPHDDFATSVDALLDAVTDRTRMVYLANPENPAGTCLTGSEIRRLHTGLPDSVLLVIDCAYEEYVEMPGHEPGHQLASEADNVVMTRTFSKIFGLAGARVGWAYGAKAIIDTLRRIGLTFPLSSPSTAAALAALEDRDHVNRIFRINRASRDCFSARMRQLGLTVYPSQANFVLIGFPNRDRPAVAAAEHLRRQGISVRRFASPLYAHCIRVTLGKETEIDAAALGITEFMQTAA